MNGVSRFNYYSNVVFISFLFFYKAIETSIYSIFYFDYQSSVIGQKLDFILYYIANVSIYIIFLGCLFFIFRKVVSGIFRTFVFNAMIAYVVIIAVVYIIGQTVIGSDHNINPQDGFYYFTGAAVMNFVIHAAMPKKNIELRPFQVFRNSVIASFSLGVIAVPIWSYLNPAIVRYQAERVAVNNHYCLMVSALGDEEYHSVTQRKQLEGLRMQARSLDSGLVFNFHAVMWVFREDKPEPYNWSYKSQGFEKISKYTETTLGLPPICEGKANFLAHLE